MDLISFLPPIATGVVVYFISAQPFMDKMHKKYEAFGFATRVAVTPVFSTLVYGIFTFDIVKALIAGVSTFASSALPYILGISKDLGY